MRKYKCIALVVTKAGIMLLLKTNSYTMATQTANCLLYWLHINVHN